MIWRGKNVDGRTQVILVENDESPPWWKSGWDMLRPAFDAMLAACDEPPNTMEIRATMRYRKERTRHAKRIVESIVCDISYHRAAGERVDWTVEGEITRGVSSLGEGVRGIRETFDLQNIKAARPYEAVR